MSEKETRPLPSLVAAEPQELLANVTEWTKKIKKCIKLVAQLGPEKEPFKFIYSALEIIKPLRTQVEEKLKEVKTLNDPLSKLWTTFTLIHIISCQAKWNESCEELTSADKDHERCISIIEELLKEAEALGALITDEEDREDFRKGIIRTQFMLIYELTRYAILSSERDQPEKALQSLKYAEEFYHKNDDDKEILPNSIKPNSILGMLDSLNSDTKKNMLTFLLFYIGQAYRIEGEKEKASLYLHRVLRRQLEEGDYSNITICSDITKMAAVLSINFIAFETSRNLLLAATSVLEKTPLEEKSSDDYKQTRADLGRAWAKLGVDILESSADRLKDLEEKTRKPPEFQPKLKFTKYEKLSLEIYDQPADIEEYDTILLINSLNFPSLDVSDVVENEMGGRYVRDYDEARLVFLAVQKWINISKEYYVIDSYCGDYIEIMNIYSNGFRHLAFFENNIERKIKMNRKRVGILENFLENLNPKAYLDICHYSLRELAEIYENIYKLKVTEIKDRGQSLRPKDKKLVKKLSQAVDSHKRNLKIFEFDIKNPKKDFFSEYEKSLLGLVLSIGRILGSITHDHPLHPEAIVFAQEGKEFYKFFLQYLDHRPTLKEDFKVLYEGTSDIPELLDQQILKINHQLETLRTY